MADVEFYRLKRINFGNHQPVYILVQNTNGPCPLIAAVNCLLLQSRMSLPRQCTQSISNAQLIECLMEFILQKLRDENAQQLQDITETLPSLTAGMDINLYFSDVSKFEYTANLTLFDVLGLNLYHGWKFSDDVFHNLGYNQAMELLCECSDVSVEALLGESYELEQRLRTLDDDIISANDAATSGANDLSCEDVSKTVDIGDWTAIVTKDVNCEADSETNKERQELIDKLTDIKQRLTKVQKAHTVQDFLDSNSTQLTVEGLEQIKEHMVDNKVCVFFRNNHFSTMIQHEKKLYLLVTDFGFVDVEEVVWECLDNINGDNQYVDYRFEVSTGRPELLAREDAVQLAAATAASLEEYESSLLLEAPNAADTVEGRVQPELLPDNTSTTPLIAEQSSTLPTSTIQQEQEYNIEASDREYALAIQRRFEEEENLRVAQRIQDDEYARSIQSRNRSANNISAPPGVDRGPAGRSTRSTTSSRGGGSGGCIIS